MVDETIVDPYRENPLVAENAQLREKLAHAEKNEKGHKAALESKEAWWSDYYKQTKAQYEEKIANMKRNWFDRLVARVLLSVFLLGWLVLTLILLLGIPALVYFHRIPPPSLAGTLAGVLSGFLFYDVVSARSRA